MGKYLFPWLIRAGGVNGLPGGKEAGFSLLEVLAAVALVGILIIPVLSMFMGSTLTVLLAGQETKAVALAQAEMEMLKGRGYAELKNELQGQEKVHWREEAGYFKKEIGLKRLLLAQLFPGAEGEVIVLEVSVFWGEKDKRRSVSLVSYLGETLGS